MTLEKKSLRILVLDDDDGRHTSFKKWLSEYDDLEVVHVTNSHGATSALSNGDQFDIVFLDHDLNDFDYSSTVNNGYGWVEATGADVARFIATVLNVEKRPKMAVVHSWNPPGAEMMCNILRDADIKVKRWTFNPNVCPLEATTGRKAKK
jgi:CheY-like chemotaxis protein